MDNDKKKRYLRELLVNPSPMAAARLRGLGVDLPNFVVPHHPGTTVKIDPKVYNANPELFTPGTPASCDTRDGTKLEMYVESYDPETGELKLSWEPVFTLAPPCAK